MFYCCAQVIRNVCPDIVVVELCPGRVNILKNDEKTLLEESRDMNITKIRGIIRQNGLLNGIFYIVLLNMSADLTKTLGMAPGGEFRRALQEVHRLNADYTRCLLQLGDRPINVTLQRALHGLSWWQSAKILWKLMMSNEEISAAEVEQCKEKDWLDELMLEMGSEYPAFREVFVRERDLYLSHALHKAAANPVQIRDPNATSPLPPLTQPVLPFTVVGVVGIGHCAGIAEHWGQVDQNKIDEISKIPPPSMSSRVTKFTIKYGILFGIGYGVFRFVRPRLPPLKFM